MPLYEYACEACGHRFEKIQKFSDALVEECPKCGAKKVHKLVSSPAIQFKGSGWYITDYAKKAAPGADGSQTAENKSAENKSPEGKDGKDGKEGKDRKSEKASSKDDKPATAPAAAASSSGDSTTPSGSSSKT